MKKATESISLDANLQKTSCRILPGFGISMGFTMVYLCLIVLIPLSSAFLKASGMGLAGFIEMVSEPRIAASLKLSFTTSLAAAVVNSVGGLLVAWTLCRYSFPGLKLVDALIDLPFALPTAVAGIALTAVYAPTGWLGAIFSNWDRKIAFTPAGITIALIFVGLPFVVRTIQPVLLSMEHDYEEAAATLGATRWQTIQRVVFPTLVPAILTGFALSFARGIGEYGSVVFISGNMPFRTEIAPLLIITKLEQYDYNGATAIAVTMLTVAFILLFLINLLQRWSRKRLGQESS